ncbi:MAG: hypothetical protein JNL28_13360 [Planctomycetes bacterium]|nr:hypothetical protein [Planctomycetota bacterium]
MTAACRVTEAKIYNLEQLHDENSHHRYRAALEGDWEYVLRHKLLSVFKLAGANLNEKSPSKVEAPADECLANLIALEEADPRDPFIAGRQVEWFARLSVEDPWSLSRERAVTGLAQAGERLAAGLPRALGGDQVPATPEILAEHLTRVVKAMRAVIERQGTRAELLRACDDVRELDLDLAGARRALRVACELVKAAGTRDPDLEPLAAWNADLQRVCITRALALAIDDKEPRVRAAALASSARIGGRAAVDTVLFDRLMRESEPVVTIAIVDTLARLGPEALEDKPGGKSRGDWLRALYTLVERSRDSEVRVHAMLALGRLSGSGLSSLREEDWQSWWYARAEKSDTGAGL